MIELLRAGHAVSILCPKDHSSAKIRRAHDTFLYARFSPLDSLTKAIEATKPDIVIPCDDLAVRDLHELYSSKRARSASEVDLLALIARSLGPPESYSIVDSRYMLFKIAREEGILTPETTAISCPDDLQHLFACQPFPWVLKVDGSTGGSGVRIAATLAEARNCFADFRRSTGLLRFARRLTGNRNSFSAMRWQDVVWGIRPALITQRFIHGRSANCAVFCWNGEVLAGVGCEVVSEQLSLGPASVVRLVDNSDMMDAAAKIARRLSLSGFIGLDFIIEEGTGSAFLIEMNPRCTQHCHLRLGKGRDMVEALSAVLKGKRPSEHEPITQNSLIAYFPQALLSGSNFLSSSYHDVPVDEPELIRELLLEMLHTRSDRPGGRPQTAVAGLPASKGPLQRHEKSYSAHASTKIEA
jgi:hypothetical protein